MTVSGPFRRTIAFDVCAELLEFLDREHVTRRDGDERVVL